MRTKIILEIGTNWKGLDDIKRSVAVARKLGALAKLQLWQTSKFIRKNNPNYALYKQYEIPREWVRKLDADDVFYSVFDPDSMLWLKTEINPEYYKVASLDSDQKWMIESCGTNNKMTFLSCGVYGLESIRRAVKWYGNSRMLTLMHCIVDYPTADAHLGYLKDRISATRVIDWGLSYNGLNPIVPVAATALGISAVEVHMRLDKITKTPDAPHSMTPGTIAKMLSGIQAVEDNMGNNDRPLDCERVHIRLGKRKRDGKR